MIGRINPVESLALKALYQTSEVEPEPKNGALTVTIDDAKG